MQKCTYTHKITERTIDGTDGRIAERIQQFLLNLLSHAGPGEVLLGGVEGRKTKLRASARDINLVLGHVPGGSVVLPMRDSPGVIRYSKTVLYVGPKGGITNSIENITCKFHAF